MSEEKVIDPANEEDNVPKSAEIERIKHDVEELEALTERYSNGKTKAEAFLAEILSLNSKIQEQKII